MPGGFDERVGRGPPARDRIDRTSRAPPLADRPAWPAAPRTGDPPRVRYDRAVAIFYDIDGANERLVVVGPLLETLRTQRTDVARLGERLHAAEADDDADPAVAGVLRARIRAVVDQMEGAVSRLDDWGIVLRDIRSGLIDFPALVNGRQVWLCWRLGEDGIDWWHDLATGFESRRPLETIG